MSTSTAQRPPEDDNNGISTTAANDAYATMTYEEALEDVHTRFVLNLPESELSTADRIFFQLEQAWWFYEDLICDPRPELNLPRYNSFKPFARMLFEYSSVLPDISKFNDMWTKFSNYKRKISNYGCILLTADYGKMILCQVWNGKSHTFPSGKINQGESGRAAAARETYEETGFDPSCSFGLTAEWKETCPTKITWKTEFTEQEMLVHQEEDGGKRRTCYVVPGVPEDFPFAPVARKEVSKVAWYSLDNIPKPSFAVLPFVGHLKRWIKKEKKRKGIRDNKSRERGKNTPKRSGSRNNSRSRNDSRGRVVMSKDDELVAAGLASAGDVSGWSEDEMFRVNEQLLGRKVDYDGNPHIFSEEGLAAGDPHAFRVVGGSFLNSGVGSLAPPPDRSRLQPLFRHQEGDASPVDGLTPFFSEDGATPWGEVVSEARRADEKTKQPSSKKPKKKTSKQAQQQKLAAEEDDTEGIFLTDRQITSKSQAAKNGGNLSMQEQYEQDMDFVRQWVAKLPKPLPTKHFGSFKLDADAIMANAERAVAASMKR